MQAQPRPMQLLGGGEAAPPPAWTRSSQQMPSHQGLVKLLGSGSFGEVNQGGWPEWWPAWWWEGRLSGVRSPDGGKSPIEQSYSCTTVLLYCLRCVEQRSCRHQGGACSAPACGPDVQLEDYISANLRHPDIVTLYTAFSVERDAEPIPAVLKRWG